MGFYLLKDGIDYGPVSGTDVDEFIGRGTFLNTDFWWHAGMTKWLQLSDFPSPAEREKLKDAPERKNWRLMLLPLFLLRILVAVFALAAALCIGAFSWKAFMSAGAGDWQKSEGTIAVWNATMLLRAMQQGALDARITGDDSSGYPVESELSSSNKVLEMLVGKNYLTQAQADKCHYMLIGNISDRDPDEAIVLRCNLLDGAIVALKNGTVRSLGNGDSFGRPAPRVPAFLPPVRQNDIAQQSELTKTMSF